MKTLHAAKCPVARYSTSLREEEIIDPLAYLRKHEPLRLFCIIVNKLLDTLIACLKHGVDPRSRNTQGVSATMFARHCHILLLWEVSLDIAGFDLATVDELFVPDSQTALAENNYRIVINPAYLSIIYDRIWIYQCWRGFRKIVGEGRTWVPPIEDIVTILKGINQVEKEEGERAKRSGWTNNTNSITYSQSSNNPNHNNQMQRVLLPRRAKASGQPLDMNASSLERFPIQVSGIHAGGTGWWPRHEEFCYTLQVNGNVAESKTGTKDCSSYEVSIFPPLPYPIRSGRSDCRMDDRSRCRGERGLSVPSVLPGLPGQFPIDDQC